MSFSFFWLDFWLQEKLFGFGIFSIKTNNLNRNLLSVYFAEGELLIDLAWFRILTACPFWWLYEDET